MSFEFTKIIKKIITCSKLSIPYGLYYSSIYAKPIEGSFFYPSIKIS